MVDSNVQKSHIESELDWGDKKRKQILVKNCRAKDFLDTGQLPNTVLLTLNNTSEVYAVEPKDRP